MEFCCLRKGALDVPKVVPKVPKGAGCAKGALEVPVVPKVVPKPSGNKTPKLLPPPLAYFCSLATKPPGEATKLPGPGNKTPPGNKTHGPRQKNSPRQQNSR